MSARTRRRGRLFSQYAALLLFVYLLLGTRPGTPTLLPVDTFFRLDPLAALTAMLTTGAILPALLWSLVTIALALVAGRVWCGWICPMGTVLDWYTPRRAIGNKPRLSSRWRTVKYLLLFVILWAALLGNQTLIFLDPITLLTRTVTTAVLPALDVAFTAAEQTLYPVSWLNPVLSGLDSLVRGPILPVNPVAYESGFVLALLFAGVIALNGVAQRFWCRYLCPLGALLGLLSRWAWIRRVVGPTCNECHLCARQCPTGTIDVDNGSISDPAECTVCLECEVACKPGAVTFQGRWPITVPHFGYDPSRRHFLGALVTGVAGVSLLQVGPATQRTSPHLIRPPGGRENNLLQKCLRCGECVKACPTGGLQPALLQDGWEGLMTPVLVPRLGYCDYSCNTCGQVCPSGAIPRLDLEVKRTVIIGWAYIDQKRCLPWADHRSCIVCEEMCPVPDKAIKLDEVTVTDPTGKPVTIGRPRVERERCIGCGICEYQCPLAGEAAIRVYAPTDLSVIG